MKNVQLSLFGVEDIPAPPKPKARSGGSGSSIVFHDYESFVAKFSDTPKTTDDCFTPIDVYEAVVKYVGTVYDLTGKLIVRPFFPGGDYQHSDYPENSVVIDNPPFSIFMKCCAFYTMHSIPFFLFGPGLTIAHCCKYCTAVIIADQIVFENGAKVKCNFASNLFGDTIIMTAPALSMAIAACPSQNQKANLPKYRYPDEVLDVSCLQTICRGGIDFSVSRDECVIIRDLDNHPNRGGGAIRRPLPFERMARKGKRGREGSRPRGREGSRPRGREGRHPDRTIVERERNCKRFG